MLNADAYGVTNGTLFLYVILLSISYKICAFLDLEPYLIDLYRFLGLTNPPATTQKAS